MGGDGGSVRVAALRRRVDVERELARRAFKSQWLEMASKHRDGDPACKAWRMSQMDATLDAYLLTIE